MQMAISLQCDTAIRACFKNGEAVKMPSLVRCCMGFQGFDNEPLIWINLTYLRPTHNALFLLKQTLRHEDGTAQRVPTCRYVL